ncbi:hypothetical protein HK100_008556 [Physocladia obscura]|uniref:Nucleotide-diphospho-sugar transferase n=1 Tax=Physocladia obscura TaxID=109957 RepID=A0AAD5SNC2_9FUNG|nr:hypothetical protein HK100_008556 [Physocladia obscura]
MKLKMKKANAVQAITLATIMSLVLFVTCAPEIQKNLWQIAGHPYLLNITALVPPKSNDLHHEIKFKYSIASISRHQTQFLDFLNGESKVNRSLAFGGSLDNTFVLAESWQFVHTHALAFVANKTYDRADFAQLAVGARAHYILYRVLHNEQILAEKFDISISSLQDTVTRLEQMLYPWIMPSYSGVRELQTSLGKGSVGIVITVGNKYFYVAQHLILSLRTVLNVTLPVEIYYTGKYDLSSARVEALRVLPNVEVIDIQTQFPSETVQLTGWAIKAWALLASRFETVLFMDADIAFFTDPTAALSSPLFLKNRLLFFHDRKLHHPGSYPGIQLLKDMNPHLSNYGANTLFARSHTIRGTTNELESGFLVLDKENTGVLFSLLLAAKMNSKLERDQVLYRKVHGDKESFWFATETLRVPYAFVPDYSGAIGFQDGSLRNNNQFIRICEGKPLHLDENRNPFWFHAGSVLFGDYRNAEPPNFYGFSPLIDMIFQYEYNDTDDLWGGGTSCITQNRKQSGKVNDAQAKIIEAYREIFRKDIKKVSSLPSR